jgi:hypothetical protein
LRSRPLMTDILRVFKRLVLCCMLFFGA